jgi:hypothetical protein
VHEVVANGERYSVAIGVRAMTSAADRNAASAIASSLKFMPLREGTTITGSPDYYVLASPGRYPVGSVTRFDATSLPRSSYGAPFSFFPHPRPRGVLRAGVAR